MLLQELCLPPYGTLPPGPKQKYAEFKLNNITSWYTLTWQAERECIYTRPHHNIKSPQNQVTGFVPRPNRKNLKINCLQNIREKKKKKKKTEKKKHKKQGK